MKKLLLVLIIVFSSMFSKEQSWYWGITAGSNVMYRNLSSDVNGNVYVSGKFWDTLTLGQKHLIADINGSIFTVKYDSTGAVKWVSQSSPSHHYGELNFSSNAVDGEQNVYLAGSFIDTVQLGKYILTSTKPDMYFVKYNANGTISWAKQAFVNAEIDAYSVTTDNKCNVYFTGSFYDSIRIEGYKLYSPNEWSTFITKFDSAGNIKWIKNSLNGGVYGSAWGYSISTDKYDNIYLNGIFWDTVAIGSFTLKGEFRKPTQFLTKYDSNGNVMWATQSTPDKGGVEPAYPATTDSMGNTYVLGSFMDTLSFDTFHLTSDTSGDIYIVKYNTNGKVVWCDEGSIPNPTIWAGCSIACDNTGHIYIVALDDNTEIKKIAIGKGTFSSSDPNAVSLLVQLDTNGNASCGYILEPNLEGYYIATSPSGKQIYLSGVRFITRWNPDCIPAGINEITPNEYSINIYPNPSNGEFTLVVTGEKKPARTSHPGGQSLSTIEIYNVLGEQVYTTVQNITNTSSFEMNLSNQPNGIYFYRVVDENSNLIGEGKLIIQR